MRISADKLIVFLRGGGRLQLHSGSSETSQVSQARGGGSGEGGDGGAGATGVLDRTLDRMVDHKGPVRIVRRPAGLPAWLTACLHQSGSLAACTRTGMAVRVYDRMQC